MTKRESILSRIQVLLTGVLPAAAPVYRSRVAAYSREETPSILVSPQSEDTEPHDSSNELSTLLVDVDIIVRSDTWETDADVYAAAIHPLIMNDAQLKSMTVRVRRNSATWESHEADLTAGTLKATYRVLYFTPPDQI